MPVPNVMADLSTLAGSNSPAGSETVFPNLDDYIRSLSAIVRSTNAVAASSIAAASTTNIAGATGEVVGITGTGTITSFGTGFAGCRRELRFDGACTLVNSSNLLLPCGINYVTSSGDVLALRCLSPGQWTVASAAAAMPGLIPASLAGWAAISPSSKADDAAVVHLAGQQTVTGQIDFASALRSTSNTVIASGSGTEVSYSGGVGYVLAYDRTASNYLPLSVRGSTLELWSNGASALLLNASANFGIGANWGSVIAGSATDLSKHVALYGSTYGLNVTSGRVNVVANGAAYGFSASSLETPGAIVVGGGKKLAKITVSNTAPGTLADGELYLKY